ncbi:MAG: cellulase family glycosylhydrolase [Candidatus Omnitrophota bacterium]
MKTRVCLFSCLTMILFLLPASGNAGLLYQDFEPDNGTTVYGDSSSATVGTATTYEADRYDSGRQVWKISTTNYWAGSNIYPLGNPSFIDFQSHKNDRLIFWMKAVPDAGSWIYGPKVTHNDVGVVFYDTGVYAENGFEVWTTEKAVYNKWTRLEVLFSQLPENFDRAHVSKIYLKNYWPGTYFIDDMQALSEDRIYQNFENPFADEYGWKWNSSDTAGLSASGEPFQEGIYSWKLVSTGYWGGTGIKSQEKKLDMTSGNPEQTFWHVDLNPAQNDSLTFWAYALPVNGMDNSLGIQLYDNLNHNTDDTKVTIWPKKTAQTGDWTKFSVSFDELPATLNLSDLNKIQFQHYWPGTFYVDDIRATKAAPSIDKTILPGGTIAWNSIEGAGIYDLQESISGPQGPWKTVYHGSETGFLTERLWPAWYRVRWEEAQSPQNPFPYISDYSEPYAYAPKPVLIDRDLLQTGRLTFNVIPQAVAYQVQYARSKDGYWNDIYAGPALNTPIRVSPFYWYRVRAVKIQNNMIMESTEWSPVQTHDLRRGYIRASGERLVDRQAEIVFKGVNLGNLFLIEPEFSGLGGNFTPDNPLDDDDYGIRQTLISRFGSDELLTQYQQAYVDESDIDRLMMMGVNLVRLPIYHLAVLDNSGKYTRFDELDRIVDLCSDRGIYVLLDLHGAPGAQSREVHSGQLDFNKLFENSTEGIMYRTQTVAFWRALASHYRDNVFVLGYDLLNEPYGALEHDPTLRAANGLWSLYNDLYRAIRLIDPNHLIVMESVPSEHDWDTLPSPKLYRWKNVMYQFHYYGFVFDEEGHITGIMTPEEHRTFIDNKIIDSRQDEYRVPVLIGEFNGFNQRENWEYYLNAFAEQGWSWTVWSYKAFMSPSDWGLYNHVWYDDEVVDVALDTDQEISEKFKRYETGRFFQPNHSLVSILARGFNGAADRSPLIRGIEPASVEAGKPFTILGRFFGETKGQSAVMLGDAVVDVLFWSDTRIVAQPAQGEWPDQAMMLVRTEKGDSNSVAVPILQPPIISAVEPTENPGQMRILGRHFRGEQGTVWFFPNNCYTTETGACPDGYAQVEIWSDTEILCLIPEQALLNGSVFVITPYGRDSSPWW